MQAHSNSTCSLNLCSDGPDQDSVESIQLSSSSINSSVITINTALDILSQYEPQHCSGHHSMSGSQDSLEGLLVSDPVPLKSKFSPKTDSQKREQSRLSTRVFKDNAPHPSLVSPASAFDPISPDRSDPNPGILASLMALQDSSGSEYDSFDKDLLSQAAAYSDPENNIIYANQQGNQPNPPPHSSSHVPLPPIDASYRSGSNGSPDPSLPGNDSTLPPQYSPFRQASTPTLSSPPAINPPLSPIPPPIQTGPKQTSICDFFKKPAQPTFPLWVNSRENYSIRLRPNLRMPEPNH